MMSAIIVQLYNYIVYFKCVLVLFISETLENILTRRFLTAVFDDTDQLSSNPYKKASPFLPNDEQIIQRQEDLIKEKSQIIQFLEDKVRNISVKYAKGRSCVKKLKTYQAAILDLDSDVTYLTLQSVNTINTVSSNVSIKKLHLKELFIKAMHLYQNEKYKESYRTLKLISIAGLSLDQDDTFILNIHHWVGLLQIKLGKYTDALVTYKKLVEDKIRILSENNISTIVSMNNLASTFTLLEKFDEAFDLYTRILNITENIPGDTSIRILSTKHSIAYILNKQGKYEASIKIYDEVLNSSRHIYGTHSNNTIKIMNDMAHVYKNQKKLNNSLDLFTKVLELTAERPVKMAAMRNVADIMVTQGRYRVANQLYHDVLTQSQAVGEKDDRVTLKTQYQMAVALLKEEKYEEAFKVFKDVLMKQNNELGEHDKDTMDTIFTMIDNIGNLAVRVAAANGINDANIEWIVIPAENGEFGVVLERGPMLPRINNLMNPTAIKFDLYSRQNKNKQQIIHGKKDVLPDFKKQTKIIIHGYKSNGSVDWVLDLKNAYLQLNDYNVIVVDWSFIAKSWDYVGVTVDAKAVGSYVAKMLGFLNDVDPNHTMIQSSHCVGHSLGAHVCGFTGKFIKKTPGLILKRITGLDPAGPEYSEHDPSERLSKDDAAYVDVIHTSTFLGSFYDIGHADFYPNGGLQQPGCPSWKFTCNHGRSHDLMIESVKGYGFNSLRCEKRPPSNIYSCQANEDAFMGEHSSPDTRGHFSLDTGGKSPFHLDCKWSLRKDLPEQQALYIKPRYKRDVTGFWMPQNEGEVYVPFQAEVLFACPGGTLNSIHKQEAYLSCGSDRKFHLNQHVSYKVNQLGCSTMPKRAARIRENAKCFNGNNNLIDIGFSLNSNSTFYTMMVVCFDRVYLHTTYSVYVLQPNVFNSSQNNLGGSKDNFRKDFYPSNIDDLYSNQLNAVRDIVGSKADTYIVPKLHYLVKGDFTAHADFAYNSLQRTTSWYINTAPQWQSFYDGNWKTLKEDIHKYATENTWFVITGTHGILNLKDDRNTPKPIYLQPKEHKIKVPLIFWKVLFNNETRESIVFTGLNNPHSSDPAGDLLTLCTDTCKHHKWLTWSPKDKLKGFVSCCELDDARKSISEIPPVEDLNKFIWVK